MFVNVSPTKRSSSESVCSLKFAARCRAVQLGQSKARSTGSGLPSGSGAGSAASASGDYDEDGDTIHGDEDDAFSTGTAAALPPSLQLSDNGSVMRAPKPPHLPPAHLLRTRSLNLS